MYVGFLKLEKSEDGQQKLAKTTLLWSSVRKHIHDADI